MFKFNFQDQSEEVTYSRKDECSADWTAACEISVTEEHISQVKTVPVFNTFICGVHKIKHTRQDINHVYETSVLDAELQHSDLIPGKYEGGFKIWECTLDLANFMAKDISHLFYPDVTVLDLGCGAGILGILASLHGCVVHFQDYNESVLNTLTIPNFLLNVSKDKDGDKSTKYRFFAGDWLSFVDLTRSKNHMYDVILTSETIYNPDNYYKLHTVFKEKLKKSGNIFVAAKTCYFGVGGSLRQFEKFLTEENCFTSVCCWTSKDGVQREILQLNFRV